MTTLTIDAREDWPPHPRAVRHWCATVRHPDEDSLLGRAMTQGEAITELLDAMDLELRSLTWLEDGGALVEVQEAANAS